MTEENKNIRPNKGKEKEIINPRNTTSRSKQKGKERINERRSNFASISSNFRTTTEEEILGSDNSDDSENKL
jgi:hypothetical protein